MLAASVLVGIWTIGGSEDTVRPSTTSILLDLYAPRDIGATPSRATWCLAARVANHCYLLQESSGDAADTGSDTGWDLTPAGSPRQGVHTPIPVAGTLVDTTSEKGTWFDGVSGAALQETTARTNLTTNLVSVTFVFTAGPGTDRRIWSHIGADGYEVYLEAAGTIAAVGNGTTVKTARSTTTVDDGVPHCMTIVLDGRTANAALFFLDGTDDTSATKDLSGTGSWTASAKPTLGNATGLGANSLTGGSQRLRLDFAATTLAGHQAVCGSMWDFNLTASKVAPADLTWTQTGSPRCFPQSATTALCVPGGSPAHGYSSTLAGLGWELEPDRTNRVLDGVDVCSTGGNWTVGGAASATCDNAVAPDGSKTADSITVGAAAPDVITQAITGYGVSATLYPRLWVKCSSGTLTVDTTVGAGQWDIACATVGGAWTELASASHAAVTEVTAWASDGAGALTLRFDGAASVSADVWGVTLVEEAAGLSVIPTAAAAQSTGTITWDVDNDPATYWDNTRGAMTVIADTAVQGSLWPRIFTGGNTSQYGNDVASKWYLYDAVPALVSTCDFDPTAGTTLAVRWNSGAPVEVTGAYVDCWLDGVQQGWGVKRLTPFSPRLAVQNVVRLTSNDGTLTTVLQRFTVESRP